MYDIISSCLISNIYRYIPFLLSEVSYVIMYSKYLKDAVFVESVESKYFKLCMLVNCVGLNLSITTFRTCPLPHLDTATVQSEITATVEK